MSKSDTTVVSKAFQEFINNVLLETLTDREKRVVALRQKDVFGFDVKQIALRKVGKQEGLSPERIRQIIFKIVRKIERKILVIDQSLKEPQVIIKYVEKTNTEKTSNLPIVYKPVEALGEMSVRTANALHNENIKTVQHLIEKTNSELLRMPNFGRKSLEELKNLLANHDLKLEENT